MKKIFLIVIVTIAVVLRFYQLGKVPVSPDWDEAALGYNAYTLLKTGRDEYGNFLPLSLRSFDDYKPPLYVYLTVPSVALFDLNVWAVRLPSAIFGVLAVVGVYFLVTQLLAADLMVKKNKSGYGRNFIALAASFLMAVSPWHIQFSRIAFEANTGVTLNIWAIYFFLLGIKKKIFLIPSAVFFGLGLYAYHSQRIFLPLMAVLLALVFRKELFSRRSIKPLMIALITGLLVIAPLIPVVFNKTALLRLRGTSSFTDQTGLLAGTIHRIEYHKARGEILGQLWDNRRFVYLQTMLGGYLTHFSPKWLFLEGDNPRHHAVDMGLIYLWELPFILWGIFSVYRCGGIIRTILFGWFLVAPVASSVTTEVPHSIRTLVFLPTFQIFSAIGIWEFIKHLRQKTAAVRVITFLMLSGAVIFNFLYYLSNYFIHMNREVSQYWQYGYEEAVTYTQQNKHKYKQVIVSTALEQSYMFFLFYTKFDPVLYLKNGGTKSGSFDEISNGFDKYIFRRLDWPNEKRTGEYLYVGTGMELSKHGDKKAIHFLDGTKAILIGEKD